MSHRHFCDFAGHYWDCEGAAVRPLLGSTEPSVCMCLTHGVSMEEGDHSDCSVELIACPEHRDEQMRAMGYAPGQAVEVPKEESEESSMFQDAEGNHIVGFCLWCNKDFYSNEEHEAHTADNMAACEAFQELKGQQGMPPVLEAMLEEAGLLPDEEPNDEK